MKKVTIFGAGNVGASAAMELAQKNICNIMLIDKLGNMAKGKALDITQCLIPKNISISIEGSGDYIDVKDSDLVIITAGSPRKPGMSRDDLTKINSKILKEICEKIKKHSPESKVMIVSNPLDLLTNLAYEYLGGNPKKILGMGGVLDGIRLISKIKKRLNVSNHDITPMVIGEHGKKMVIVPEYTTVSGIPITKLFEKNELEKISDETKKGGEEIVNLLEKGSAFYAPAQAIAITAQSILLDLKQVICCCAYLSGAYGVNDIFIGVPAVLGKNGVEKIFEMELSHDSKSKFDEAIKTLREKLPN